MRRLTYDEIKHRKNFYRNSFRKTGKFLMVSIIINIVLAVGIYLKLITTPIEDFYATNGTMAPIQLTAISGANKSSQPLLEDDPVEEVTEKELPAGT